MSHFIETYAYARAGLIGNPSDGYFGKTISLSIRNFRARVICYPSANLQIKPGAIDKPIWSSIEDLREGVKLQGYYGGVRLIRAIIKQFADYCDEQSISLPHRNFTIEYESNIPGRVGLAGSSAIITAALRALMIYFDVEIPKEIQPNIILAAEKDELGIGAGLQDRVIQVYEDMVFMDFEEEYFKAHGHGKYEPIEPNFLPNIFIAYDSTLSEGSEVFHNNIRERFDAGDKEVVDAMKKFAGFAQDARDALISGRKEILGELMDQNFDLRATLYKLRQKDLNLVMRGREIGAHTKFAGSGGAIIGVYDDDEMLEKLRKTYQEMGAELLVPQISAA